MTFSIRDHAAYQRAAIALVAGGALLGAFAALTSVGSPALFLAATVGAAALATPLLERGRPVTPSPKALVLGVAGADLLAWYTSRALGVEEAWLTAGFLESALAGGLFALVASLGLVPAQLVRGARDPVARALADLEPGLADEERVLADRAIAAHARIEAGLSADRSQPARDLRATITALAVQVIELGGRARALRRELEAATGEDLRLRANGLLRAAKVTDDELARADFARAAQAAASLRDRLRALRAAKDRAQARLEVHVSALEETALCLATRRASVAAHDAAALAPLTDRLRETGVGLDAEALALEELQREGSSPGS
jgi:DNA-binding transcriptional ArsR family regulator